MNPDLPSPDQLDPAIAERLRRALRDVQPPVHGIPRRIDDAILAAARDRLRRPDRPPRPAPSWWRRLCDRLAAASSPSRIAWATGGAALLILVLAVRLHRPTGTPSAFDAADRNHDGTVDMLDAFALARRLAGDPNPAGEPDLNGDGVVDQRDVAVLAARAVRLPPPTPPGP